MSDMQTINAYPIIGRGSIAELTPAEVGQDVMRLRHYGFQRIRIDGDELTILGDAGRDAERDRKWYFERHGLSEEKPTRIND